MNGSVMARKKKIKDITPKDMLNRVLAVAELLSRSEGSQNQTATHAAKQRKTQNT